MTRPFYSSHKTLFSLYVVLITLTILANSVSCKAQQMLWGVASEGGEFGVGAIFKVNEDGSGLEVKKSFQAISGRSPSYNKLIQSPSGKLYGMTPQGGSFLKGVIFEFNPVTNSYRKIHDFDGENTGSHPYGGLVLANNGKFYGMTSSGGEYDKGVLFEFDYTTDSYVKKFDFQGIHGESPYSDLVEAIDGILYGVTSEGGAYSFGVIFNYDPSNNIFTKKIDFNGAVGKRPFGSMISASNGNLFGMTNQGGQYSKGAIYEYNIGDNSVTKRFYFSGTTDGAYPTGNLIQANNGLLYGMTLGGGTTNQGVLFAFNPNEGTGEAKIHFNGANGQAPYGSLTQATNGRLYGVTEQGVNDFGGLFEFEITTGVLTNLVTFDGLSAGNGGSSRTTVTQVADGKLFGMNSIGGMTSDGVLFSYDPISLNYQIRVSFGIAPNGDWPLGNLVQGANGRIYGTTYSGGNERAGVLFEYDISHETFSKKIDFDFSNGAHPASGMILASNEKLYGVTRFGGTSNGGVLFEFNPSNNQITKKIDFDSEFGRPIGALLQIPNGKIYAVSENGGVNDMGTLFEYNPIDNSIITRIDFDGAEKGSIPTGGLIFENNKLYGLTREGGVYNNGVLFEFDLSLNSFVKILDFDGFVNGTNPIGSLVKAQNNKFYGITNRGGANNWGVIFEYDPTTTTFTNKINFTGISIEGVDIQCGFIESFNGKLYTTTNQGGINNLGVLLEYDPIENKIEKKQDFIGVNGARPYSILLPVSLSDQTITFEPPSEKTSIDNPFPLIASSSSGLPITFSSNNTSVATVNGNVVTIKNGGTATLMASQKGNINFHPALDVTQPLTVILIIATDDELSYSQLMPYPNPTKDEFFIQIEDNEIWKELIAYDQFGRSSLIPVEKLEGNTYRCVTNSLTNGIYFIPFSKKKESIKVVVAK